MLEKLPSLPREFMRREDEPGWNREIWQPSWKCFCCHDTGTVQSHLAALIIEGYSLGHDKLLVCQNPACDTPVGVSGKYSNCLDFRLNATICKTLDKFERDAWRKWVRERQEKYKEINAKVVALADAKSLRERVRTPYEELEVQQSLEEVRVQ